MFPWYPLDVNFRSRRVWAVITGLRRINMMGGGLGMGTPKALAVLGYLAAWFQNINDRFVRSTAPGSSSHVSHKRVWWEKPGSLLL